MAFINPVESLIELGKALGLDPALPIQKIVIEASADSVCTFYVKGIVARLPDAPPLADTVRLIAVDHVSVDDQCNVSFVPSRGV